MSTSYLHGSAQSDAGGQSAARRETIIRPPSLMRLDIVGSLARLVEYRDLLYTLSIHRIKVRYKQTALGVSWAIVQPLSIMLLFTLVFSLIVNMPSEGVPYAVFAYAALLPWTYFSTALSNGTNGLVSNSPLITKVYFPREILPLTYVIAALFDLLIASSVLLALMIYYRISLSLSALYAIPIILILTVFVSAVALLFSAVQIRFRDIGVAVPLLLQIWMFATPVAYPLSAVPNDLRHLYLLNPMVGIIENFRRVILHGAAPDLSSLGIAGLTACVMLCVSFTYFKRVEATMADII